jgi:hypothetical protein
MQRGPVASRDLLGRVAEHVGHASVDLQPATVGFGDRHAHESGVEELPQPLLAVRKCLRGALAFVDRRDEAVPQRAAVGQLLWRGIPLMPANLAIARDAVLTLPRRQCRGRLLDRRQDVRQIVRQRAREQRAGVGFDGRRRDAEQVVKPVGGERHRHPAIGPELELVEHPRHVARQSLQPALIG